MLPDLNTTLPSLNSTPLHLRIERIEIGVIKSVLVIFLTAFLELFQAHSTLPHHEHITTSIILPRQILECNHSSV